MPFRPDREKLTKDRTYYVRSDGSDSNDGLSNSSSGAFLTPQKAVNVASLLDNGGNAVTINIVDTVGGGTTYTVTSPITLRNHVGEGQITIQGNTGTATDVIIQGSNSSCFNANLVQSKWRIQNLQVQTVTAGSGIIAQGGSRLTVTGVFFGAVAGGGVHMQAANRSYIDLRGANYTISGGAVAHYQAQQNSEILCTGTTVTVTGTPAFTTAFCRCFRNSVIGATSTFSGSATGQRYSIFQLGSVFTFGGANHFPGSTAGGTSGGGQYV